MRKSANIEKTDRAERSSWSVRALGSQVGMSPIGSYVGGLTSKGQVGVLLGEHRGWILRMAALIKGRLSDNRPEAFAASFQNKRIQNICMLPDVLVCFRKTACIFSHYLSQKSSTGPSLLDSTRFRQNVSSPVSLYRPAI